MAEETNVSTGQETTAPVQEVPNKVEQLKILGSEVVQEEIASIGKGVFDGEEKLKIKGQELKVEAICFYEKYRTEIIIIGALLMIHVAGKFGLS